MSKPLQLYHGSPLLIEGALETVLRHSPDHIHSVPTVFGTDNIAVASLFMFPVSILASIGFEQNSAYICIWGTYKDYISKDGPGYMYVLLSETFEKIGKDYEWQSTTAVVPSTVKTYPSVLQGMMENGVQVYFINDEKIFDSIRDHKANRAIILKNMIPENARRGFTASVFN